MLEIKPRTPRSRRSFYVYWKAEIIGYLFRISSRRLDKVAKGWKWGSFYTGKSGVCTLRRDAIEQIRKKK